MGTELGATSSIFPTDDETKDYLARLGREDVVEDIGPDEDAEYADEIVVDLSDLEPLIAEPSMPDNVVPVSEVEGVDVEQVMSVPVRTAPTRTSFRPRRCSKAATSTRRPR